jgi:hypothetical protein
MDYPAGAQAGRLDRNWEQNAAQPKPFGIASRIAELQQEVQAIAALAYQTKATLGITSPETPNTKAPQPSTLAEVLTDLRVRLMEANRDLQDVIQHLNS